MNPEELTEAYQDDQDMLARIRSIIPEGAKWSEQHGIHETDLQVAQLIKMWNNQRKLIEDLFQEEKIQALQIKALKAGNKNWNEQVVTNNLLAKKIRTLEEQQQAMDKLACLMYYGDNDGSDYIPSPADNELIKAAIQRRFIKALDDMEKAQVGPLLGEFEYDETTMPITIHTDEQFQEWVANQ